MRIVEKIEGVVARLMQYGWKGVKGWVARSVRNWFNRRFIIRNARRNRRTVPVRGVTVVGPLTQSWSMSKTMRDLIVRLKESGIPYQTFDTGATCDRVNGGDYAGLLTPRKDYNARRFGMVLELHFSTFPKGLGPRCGRVCFWEADVAFRDLCPDASTSDFIVTMSDFNQVAIGKVFAAEEFPVKKLLYPLLPVPGDFAPASEVRAKYGLKTDDFVVFSNFDLGSYPRKNPLGMLRAFAAAFPSERRARLVFKVNHAATCRRELGEIRQLADALKVSDRLVIIEAYIPQRDVYGLTNACDVYFSLNRGEGFGLGIAEAMSLSKPVVITDFGAPLEFCNRDNAMLVPYTRIPVRPGEYFEKIGTWPEADTDAAAEALNRLYTDPILRQKLGDHAKRSIESHFSAGQFKSSVDDLLDAFA